MSLGFSMDESVDINEEVRFKQRHKEEMLELAKTTHFNFDCVQRLSLVYHHIVKLGKRGSKGITREQLTNVLHYGFDMTDYHIMDEILSIIDKGEIFQRNVWTLTKWINTLSLYFRGTLEEQIRYAYEVYVSKSMVESDLNKKLMLLRMKHTLIKEIGDENEENEDEAVRDLVDVMIQKMDHDADGSINFDDFRQTVLDNPLMLECLGPVLPTRQRRDAIRQTFTSNYGQI